MENLKLSDDFKMKFNVSHDYLPGTFEQKYIDHFCNGDKLTNMEEFISSRQHFKEFGSYTNAIPNNHPNSQWIKFWKEEQRRCLEGYNIGRDWIPGYLYFYWNYTPIHRVNIVSQKEGSKKQRAERIFDFPDLYDIDYYWYHYLEEAEKRGQHGANIKKRGVGFSFKGGSMMCRNYFLIPGSKSYAFADQKEYLIKDGILTKAWELMDWIDDNTAWTKRRLKNAEMHRQSGYQKMLKTGAKINAGYKSEIIGVTVEGDTDKARGKRGKLILWEESGNNKVLREAWVVALSSMQEDNATYGLMVSGGCLTKNNLVWNNKGNLIPIADLNINEGILGFDSNTNEVSKENISYWQPPTKKHCIRITTNTGRFIECSVDHPILWSNQHYGTISELPKINNKRRRQFKKAVKFKRADEIYIGDQLAIIDSVNIFGDKEMWNPRLIGWLIGDGSYGFDKTPVLSNCEKEINDYIYTNFDCSCERTNFTKLGKIYKETRIKGITKNLRELGVYGQVKKAKRLPLNFQEYSKHSMAEVIGGLFDTDGYISKKGKISISQCNKELLLELLLALQKFGIHGNILFKKPNLKNPKSKNGHYELEIADKYSILNFVDNIRLHVKFKQDILESLVELYHSKKIEHASHLKGIKFERVTSLEYVGLQDVYNLTTDTTHTYIGNGIITHNTGGTEGADFQGLEELVRKPDGYNIYGIPNIFDGRLNEKTAFFIPTFLNRRDCFDKDGNSDIVKAVSEIDIERKITKKNMSPNIYLRTIAEHPYTIDEAILRMEGSPFDVGLVREVLAQLKVENSSSSEPGEFIINDSGKVEWRSNFDLQPIDTFPLSSKDNNKEGCWVIYNKPQKTVEGTIANWRYIAGNDPIDFGSEEVSTGNKHSLASTFIIDSLTRNIVAEYTGRPEVAEKYYEQLWRGIEYYNAELLYENNLKGLFSYFRNKNKLHLLANEPESLKDRFGYKVNNRIKGFHATPAINGFGRELINKWSLEEYIIDQNQITGELNTQPRMWTIKSIPLLQEMEKWNNKDNYDRISSLGACLILLNDREIFLQDRVDKVNSRIKDSTFFKRIQKFTTKSNQILNSDINDLFKQLKHK